MLTGCVDRGVLSDGHLVFWLGSSSSNNALAGSPLYPRPTLSISSIKIRGFEHPVVFSA